MYLLAHQNNAISALEYKLEIDDLYWGGEVQGETPGRGPPNKIPFVAVAAKTDKGHPITLRTSVVAEFSKTEPAHWAAKLIHPDIIFVSDGLARFRGIADAGIEKWIPKIGQRDKCILGSSRQPGGRFTVHAVRRTPVKRLMPSLGVVEGKVATQ
ncbi:hypothetical protein THIOKS11090002 [Thiocapsa sp. KS1]|nr:transposase [Thiocapsa sp. KS1]CRI62978.1 hypothetical protein THIOKS11090002 [Thiocapsa sp. KS1]